MEETISLKELLETLRKRVALIIALMCTAVLISGIVSFFVLTPIYQASTQILVNQSSKGDQSLYNPGEVQTNLQLINTYNAIIKSPAVLDIVRKELKLKMTTAELNEKMTVASETNSQVINLSVQDTDPKMAALIANKTAQVLKKQVRAIMKTDNVIVLAQADVTSDSTPIKPKPLLNIAIAGVVGLMVGIGLAFLLEYLDNTIKNEQDVEKLLGLPILGVITNIEDQKIDKLKARRNDRKSTTRGESFGA